MGGCVGGGGAGLTYGRELFGVAGVALLPGDDEEQAILLVLEEKIPRQHTLCDG